MCQHVSKLINIFSEVTQNICFIWIRTQIGKFFKSDPEKITRIRDTG